MGGFVIFCGELDENLSGRGIACDLRPRKIYRMPFVGFIDVSRRCSTLEYIKRVGCRALVGGGE